MSKEQIILKLQQIANQFENGEITDIEFLSMSYKELLSNFDVEWLNEAIDATNR